MLPRCRHRSHIRDNVYSCTSPDLVVFNGTVTPDICERCPYSDDRLDMNNVDKPFLTIATATRDDFHGVYFTLTSIMQYHREVLPRCEFLVIDNNPDSPHGRKTQSWVIGRAQKRGVWKSRYVPFTGPGGTAQPREEIFKHAKGEFVLVVDCHVMIDAGAISRLIKYYEEHPDTIDLHSGPLIQDNGDIAGTHQRPEWGAGAWGKWTIDDRGRDPNNEPFEIWQQGMGLFSCRRDAWVHFHPLMRGFGGCESYIMEKFRRRGGRVLCMPFLRWTHRFQRPDGVPYRVTTSDKFRNYCIGFTELGWEEGIQGAMTAFGKRREQVDAVVKAAYEGIDVPAQPKPAVRVPTGGRRMNQDIAVVGDTRFGGTRLRGQPLAQHLQCKFIHTRQSRGMGKRAIVVYVKDGGCSATIRAKCERLIYDPLDVYFGSREIDTIKFWQAKYNELKFDDLIATSPACASVMKEALGDKVRIHMFPHNSDPIIQPDWRDPEGHIAYAGLRRFIEPKEDVIREACDIVGRPLKTSTDNSALRGAALCLAIRLPPYNTKFNDQCKPQIKIENAAAANLPVVCTEAAASLTLRPELQMWNCVISVDFTAQQLADAIERALKTPGLKDPYTTQDFVSDMEKIIRLT